MTPLSYARVLERAQKTPPAITLNDGQQLCVLMVYGSHLYGTSSPASDADWKGVYIPSPKEVLLGRVRKSLRFGTAKDGERKNAAGDVDCELYSLPYFLELACEGQTVAIDMLHAPPEALHASSRTWKALVSSRHSFYTRNLQALVGYARRQAAKYGIKGSRLADAKRVLEIMLACPTPANTRVEELDLLELEHARFVEGRDGVRLYQVCGKQLNLRAKVEQYIPMLAKYAAEYGDRARQAEQNAGVDWKAISHALRAGYEVRHILASGGFTFPLTETDYLVSVKRGEVPWAEAGTALDGLLAELEALSAARTDLPARIDPKTWDVWLLLEYARAWGRRFEEAIRAHLVEGTAMGWSQYGDPTEFKVCAGMRVHDPAEAGD